MTKLEGSAVDAAAGLDPESLLDQLEREVKAARALVTMTTPGDARRRAALDALSLCADLLADARAAWRGDECSHPVRALSGACAVCGADRAVVDGVESTPAGSTITTPPPGWVWWA